MELIFEISNYAMIIVCGCFFFTQLRGFIPKTTQPSKKARRVVLVAEILIWGIRSLLEICCGDIEWFCVSLAMIGMSLLLNDLTNIVIEMYESRNNTKNKKSQDITSTK